MTVRDLQNDFVAPSDAAARLGAPFSMSIIGSAGTFLLPNTWDTGALSAYLTELNPNDTLLTVGNQTLFVDEGAAPTLKAVFNWTQAPVSASGSYRVQLITASNAQLATPTVMLDTGAIAAPASPGLSFRQVYGLPRAACSGSDSSACKSSRVQPSRKAR